jgi:hypothetical protein
MEQGLRFPRRFNAPLCIIVSILAGMVSACGTTSRPPVVKMNDLSPEQLSAVNAVKVYNQAKIARRPFDILKAVQGISCKNSFWGHEATKRDAILQTRFAAQQAGADGIINLQCESPPEATATYDCSAIMICTGEAIKFKAGEAHDRVEPAP